MEGNYAVSIIQYPSGRWGFVGSVPIELSYCKKDGGDLSDEDIDELMHTGSIRISLEARGLEGVSFETREEAEKTLNKFKGGG